MKLLSIHYNTVQYFLDIINCVSGSNLCDQICNELEGGYSCSCEDGYRLRNDNVSCEGICSIYVFYIASCVVYIHTYVLIGSSAERH